MKKVESRLVVAASRISRLRFFLLFLGMKKVIPSIFFLLFVQCPLFAQYDLTGSGRAIEFDGTDDYIDLGNIYDDITLPLTISAWVYVKPSDKYILPIFASQDNASLYNGFWFCLSAANLFFEYGDGKGSQNPAYRRGKSAPVGNIQNRWMYVSAVVNNGNDIKLYVNGQDVGGAYTGSSSLPMDSDFPTDVAKIGYFHTNSVTHRFVGMMDEIRIWNRCLSENEIRQTMCRRLTGSEISLIGHWTFDETTGEMLTDSSPNQFDGTLLGNPVRVFSGAPVGEESLFLYTSSWPDKSLTHGDLTVENISGTPFGVQIYSVDKVPSQTGGLAVTNLDLPYYGIFLADDGGSHTFDLRFAQGNVCSVSQRSDNSEPDWHESTVFTGVPARIEMIPSFQTTSLDVDMGEDVIVCEQNSFTLEADPEPSGKTFLWSTGEKTSSINITSTGTYSVKVIEGCQQDADTIHVSFLRSPSSFSLGEDEVLCSLEPRILKPGMEPDGLSFTWQDGSRGTSIEVADFGTYWLKAENACGASVDSISFEKKVLKEFISYNFISPDNQDAFNQVFVLDESLRGTYLTVFNRWGKPVFESPGYQNNWNGDGLPAGIYFYTVRGECFEPLKGTLTISR